MQKRRQFIIAEKTKQILLQAVRSHEAHRAPHGKKDEAFEKRNYDLEPSSRILAPLPKTDNKNDSWQT